MRVVDACPNCPVRRIEGEREYVIVMANAKCRGLFSLTSKDIFWFRSHKLICRLHLVCVFIIVKTITAHNIWRALSQLKKTSYLPLTTLWGYFFPLTDVSQIGLVSLDVSRIRFRFNFVFCCCLFVCNLELVSYHHYHIYLYFSIWLACIEQSTFAWNSEVFQKVCFFPVLGYPRVTWVTFRKVQY